MKKGFTLVETALAIVIIAISFYSIIAVFASLLPRTANLDSFTQKVYLGQEKIEEYLARDFNSVNSVGETAFAAPFAAFKYQIIVTYVTSADVNTPVAGPTDFKNVRVRTWGGSVDPASSIEIVSLVTTYEIH